MPDKYNGWKTRALKAVSKHLSHSTIIPDVVVTFAQPFTDHLVGLELKRRYGLKWVAHFSDPWTDNPFHSYIGRTRAQNLRLEEAVVNGADMTILTSDETLDLVYRKYSQILRQKARVLPHCYDRSLFPGRPDIRDDRIRIRYVGNFYGSRTPEPLIAALRRLVESEPDTLSDITFELTGDIVTTHQQGALDLGLPKGLLEIGGPVNYRDSLRLMAEADGLLVIDAPSEKSVFLPSKLIDYVGAGRPIFGITPEGAASNLIKRLGGYVAAPEDTDSVIKTIKDFLEFLKSGNTMRHAQWGVEDVRAQYEAPNVAEKFMNLLEEVRTTT